MTSTIEPLHATAPTRFVDANGTRFAFRRFGQAGGVPLVLFQHLMGNMDNYDPAITNALARDRELILFDQTGVASTDGTARESIADMTSDAASFIDALGLQEIDVFGHSMGGHVSQQLAIAWC
jgi:pimeloyl-ACP methyl ester carboxylesterase